MTLEVIPKYYQLFFSPTLNVSFSATIILTHWAVKIAEYLESDPPIDRIDLDHNRLNDDDAILISQALKRNTNLKTICLLMNNITSIGVKVLLNCVFDSSSLNAISESNHTLEKIDVLQGVK